MKKKLVLVLLLATLVLGGAFAQEKFLSVGASVSMVPTFGSFERSVPVTSYYTYYDSDIYTGFGFGFDAFLDVKYATLSVGLLLETRNQLWRAKEEITFLNIGLIGKYPFSLGEKFALYPYAGVDLNIALGGKLNGFKAVTNAAGYTVSDYWTNLAIVFGVGFDFNLTDSMYLRLEAGYGISLPSKWEHDYWNDKVSKGSIPVKFAFGYKF
jgi:opacity protein-like surface antigen